MNIWQCPGPNRALAGIAGALYDGRDVILRTPDLVPDDIELELARLMGEAGWYVQHLDDNGADPVRQVLDMAGRWELLGQSVQAELLLKADLSGQVYWVRPTRESERERWLSFLDAYMAACRSACGAEGPRFVLELASELGELVPVKQVGIDVVDLGDCVTTVDLALIAYHRVGAVSGGSLKGQVMAQVATSLARWDVHLLVRLLDEPPEVLFDPVGMLKSYAVERGWSDAEAPCWREGTLRRFLRREEVHSARLAFQDVRKEIQSRVWAGQAAVLMPAIERRRLEVIERNHGALAIRMPFETEYAIITDPSDLDFNPLYYLLSQETKQ